MITNDVRLEKVDIGIILKVSSNDNPIAIVGIVFKLSSFGNDSMIARDLVDSKPAQACNDIKPVVDRSSSQYVDGFDVKL